MGELDCNNTEQQECLNEFIGRVQKYMTLNCQMPFTLPVPSIALITEESKKWFYNHYDDSVEEQYIACDPKVFRSDEFRLGLTNRNNMDGNAIKKAATKTERGVIVMPDNVFSVIRVYQIGKFSGEAGWGGMFNVDADNIDFGVRRMFSSQMYYSGVGMSADTLLWWTCNLSYYDMARTMLQEMHTFSYNRLTRKVRFGGELPTRAVVFEVMTTVEDCQLFQDDLFFRYVCAQCMRQIERLLSTFSFTLPGNVQINTSVYTSWGEAELQDIKEEIKQSRSSVSYFFTT